MGRLFDLDSPLFSFLNKLTDLIYLNILTILCCIPVFTVGASMTALNYVVLKMVRNEEGYVTKAFFKSFKQNFKQATIIWLILLLAAGILIGDGLIMRYSGLEFPSWFRMILSVLAFTVVFATMHVFPVLSRFENSIKQTFRNSFLMGILSLPRTILMMVCWIVPIVAVAFFVRMLPLVFILGISGPAFLNALLYHKTFKRFEPEENENSDEWTLIQEEKPE